MILKLQNQVVKNCSKLGGLIDIQLLTAVLINDLKHKKTHNYDFNWESTLQNSGNSGIKLQYTHSRLHNLLEANKDLLSKCTNVSDLNFELLNEAEAMQLLLTVSRFEETLKNSYVSLEPSILVKYLFVLCDDVSKAIKVLQVKGAEEERAALRFLLFYVSKKVLCYSMTVLGLKPLNKM